MLIRFAGPKTRRRLWGPYVFSRVDGMVQDVDDVSAAAMLTHPGDQFEVDGAEPLLGLRGVDENMAGLLAFEGIGCVQDVAGLSRTKAGRLGKAVGVTRVVAQGWIEEARAMVESGEAAVPEMGLEKRGCCG